MESLEGLLCCPLCRGALSRREPAYFCGECRREYPFVLGMADFRIEPPPTFDAAQDLRFAELLTEREAELSFSELVAYYYRLNPEASEELHEAHMAHFAVETEHSEEAMRLLAPAGEPSGNGVLLDLGCGMGQYLRAASGRFAAVVGADLALFQLVLARKHLAESRAPLLLVAAEAERLPFRPGAFAAVTAADVIEHVAEPRRVVEQAARLLQPRGRLFLTTPNRFSLTPEPHVGIWGLGYLPHAWAVRYVRRRLGIAYEDIRLFSCWRLRRLLRSGFGETADVRLPAAGAVERKSFSPNKARLARVYEWVRRTPVLRSVLYLFAPYFQAVCEKR